MIWLKQLELDLEVADVEDFVAQPLLLLLHNYVDHFILLLQQLAQLQIRFGEHQESFVELCVKNVNQF